MNLKIIAALSMFLSATTAYSADYPISSITMRTGTSSGSVSDLALAGDAKVFKFYTNGKGNLTIDFQATAKASTTQLFMNSKFLQVRASDVFSVSYRNAAGSFISVGKITGSAGVFKDVKIAIPQAAIINGSVLLRLKSNAGADDGQIDQMALVDGAAVPAPTPTPEPTPTPTPTPTPVPPPTAGGVFVPGATWYWQLQGTIDTSKNVKIYDIDLYDTPVATIQSLKASGKTVICYFSAGSHENWRSDASEFPAVALGNPLDGWAGERWLDVRNAEVLNIMGRRMDLAKSKGCDALEPDNVDGYSNKSGFPLTAQDQINYLSRLADLARARGLPIALKNSTDLVAALVDKFDFAVVEECFKYNECQMYSPFVQKGKAVLNAEYTSYSGATCSTAANLKFSTAFYNLALDGRVFQPCP